MNNKRGKFIKNFLIIGILFGITVYIVFKDNSIDDIINSISKVNGGYLIGAISAMCIFITCEGINIGRPLRALGYKVGILKSVKYALIGFFFSSVTPSASGGQPMQLYYMNKDNIKVSHGTLALLFELLSFETVTVTLSIIGYITQRQAIDSTMGSMKGVLVLGLSINLVVMAVLVMAIFSKKMVNLLINTVVRVVSLINSQKAEQVRAVLESHVLEYQNSSIVFKENKIILFKTVITTLVQIIAFYAIPFLIYRGFGNTAHSPYEIMALEAVLYVSVSALPLPGGMGVSEGIFMILFSAMYSKAMLASATVLTRGISFYLFVLISGICTCIFTVISKKENGIELHNSNSRGRSGYSDTFGTIPEE